MKASEMSLNESLIRLAILHERKITFSYAKGPFQRNIEVRSGYPDKLDATSVLVEDCFRDEWRRFRLDRIKGDVKIESD